LFLNSRFEATSFNKAFAIFQFGDVVDQKEIAASAVDETTPIWDAS